MRSVLLGFVLGIALLQKQADLLHYWVYVLGLLIGFCTLIAFWKVQLFSKVVWFKCLFQLLSSCCIGFCWAGLMATWAMSEELPLALQGKDIQVVGVIDQLPTNNIQGTRFQFQIEKVLPSDQFDSSLLNKIPKKMSLGWFDQTFQSTQSAQSPQIQTSSIPTLKPGQRWLLTVRLKRPHGNANPNGFDYEVWLLEQGVRSTGAVRPETKANPVLQNRLLDDFVWSVSNVIERCRYNARERMLRLLPNATYAGVLVALVVGDQKEVAQSDWQVFNRTGIGHLVSISGLHITMIAGLFSGLMYFLWRHSFFTNKQLPLLIPAQKIAAIAGVIAAVLYVALAGFGVPAQRTLWMLIVVALAMWTGRLTSISHILCLALGLVVLIDPWAVLWPGFWLSFFAVAILLYVSLGRMQVPPSQTIIDNIKHSLLNAGRLQYAVTVGLLPLTLLLFGQVSIVSPIANAIAIPLISFVVTPLALIGNVLPDSFAVYVFSFAHACVEYLVQFLSFLSTSSIAVWQVPLPTPAMFILALIGTLWLLAPRGWPMRYLGMFCWLPILLQSDTHPPFGAMNVVAFDVGQGSAVLVETANHRLLYDTGPSYSFESNGGNRVLLPYFQSRGIRGLDTMMISHSDNDHSGGALSILENMNVAQTMTSLDLHHPIMLQSKIASRCHAGQTWVWDAVQFEVLQPIAESYQSSKWKPNARSCTLKISTKHQSILLAGDIEALQEDEMVNMIPEKLPATVLLAPHHGSGTSSTLPFLNLVKPELALFQLGYLNRYGHPKPFVWQRYQDLGIKRIRTDISGAITLQFGAEEDTSLHVQTLKQEHARYWYQK